MDKIAPLIHQLGMIQTLVCKQKKSHIRFNTDMDSQLSKLVQFYKNDLTKLWKELSDTYSKKFSKKCRDRYNTYIDKHEFTPEEDKIILESKNKKLKWRQIAKSIDVKYAKQVQNRYYFLASPPITDYYDDHNTTELSNPQENNFILNSSDELSEGPSFC
jgi:hypothetical protein